jgi:hypothetical protein
MHVVQSAPAESGALNQSARPCVVAAPAKKAKVQGKVQGDKLARAS